MAAETHTGCNSGGKPGWNQSWRAPLRKALDHLRDSLVKPYETKAAELLLDPWLAREDYVNVVLDRSDSRQLPGRSRPPGLSEPETVTVLSLLEMQRHAMLMYAGCRLVLRRVVRRRNRASHHVRRTRPTTGSGRLFPDHHEETFRELLRAAKSDLPNMATAPKSSTGG